MGEWWFNAVVKCDNQMTSSYVVSADSADSSDLNK